MMNCRFVYIYIYIYIYIYHESLPSNVGIIKQQESQCITYKVTLRRVCATNIDRKAIVITYSGYVFAALGIYHTMRMRHIVACGLPGSTVFFYVIL